MWINAAEIEINEEIEINRELASFLEECFFALGGYEAPRGEARRMADMFDGESQMLREECSWDLELRLMNL